MASKVIPLDTNEDFDDDWGQYVIIDMDEIHISSSYNLTSSLLDLEEDVNIQETKDKYCTEICTIC